MTIPIKRSIYLQLMFVISVLSTTNSYSSDTENLIRDPRFKLGLAFNLPSFDEEYQIANKITTNNGLVDLINPSALWTETHDTDITGDLLFGANRLYTKPVQPVWNISSWGMPSTAYDHTRDINASGGLILGPSACPSGESGPCVFKGRYTPDDSDDLTGSAEIVTLTLGRGQNVDPDTDPDFSIHIDFIKQFLHWGDIGYWASCMLYPLDTSPSDFSSPENDPVCEANVPSVFTKDILGAGATSGKHLGKGVHHYVAGQGWPHIFVQQFFAGNTNLGNMQSARFTGKVRLNRINRLQAGVSPDSADCTAGDTTTCTTQCSTVTDPRLHTSCMDTCSRGMWDFAQSKWLDCAPAGGEIAIFQLGIDLYDRVLGGSIWFGVLSSVDKSADTYVADSDGHNSNGAYIDMRLPHDNFSQTGLAAPANWILDHPKPPASGATVGGMAYHLPNYVVLSQLSTGYANTDAQPDQYGLNLAPDDASFDSGWLFFDIDVLAWMEVMAAAGSVDVNGSPYKFLSNNINNYSLRDFYFSFESSSPIDQELQLKDLSLTVTYKNGAVKQNQINTQSILNNFSN